MLPVASEVIYVDTVALPASLGVLYGVKIKTFRGDHVRSP